MQHIPGHICNPKQRQLINYQMIQRLVLIYVNICFTSLGCLPLETHQTHTHKVCFGFELSLIHVSGRFISQTFGLYSGKVYLLKII